jgi:hypothetical protein
MKECFGKTIQVMTAFLLIWIEMESSIVRAFFKISGIGWGCNWVSIWHTGNQLYPSQHHEVKVIINLNIHRSWGIGWGEILHPLYLKSGKAYKCRVTPLEQGVLEITPVGSHLKGDYFRNSLLPGRYQT